MDLELERLFQRLADRAKPKPQDPPPLRVRTKHRERKNLIICLEHDKFIWRCVKCQRVYNRNWRRRNVPLRVL